MKLSFKIAYRFLKNNKTQTLLIALAIGIGISIQIFLGMLIQNLQDDLVNNTIGGSSHLTLKAENNDIIEDSNNLKEKLKTIDNRIITSIEVLDRPGLISKDKKSLSVLLRGFNLKEAEEIYKFNDKLIEGNIPVSNNEILVGTLLSDELEAKVGSKIKLLTPENETVDVLISGIVDFKVEALNKNYIITDLKTIRNIYNTSENSITAIETQVGNKNIFDVEEISNTILNETNNEYQVSNWIQANESLLSGLKGQSASSYTIQVFIVLSVIVAIASILAINVMQKTKQIGILKAMGITDKMASSIFIIQGVILGLIGALLGTIMGISLFKIFTIAVKNSDGTPLISGNINLMFIAVSIIIAICACVISSIIPARKSLKLNPVEAIRL